MALRAAACDATVAVKVMLVEDDADVSRAVLRVLSADGIGVEVTEDPMVVLSHLEKGTADWDVVLLDVGLGLPNMNGIDVLHRFREAGSFASVVMLTGDNTAATALTCMRGGAFHYLTKPVESFELRSLIASAARYSTLRRELASARQTLSESTGSLLVGTSPAIRQLRATISRLADRDVPVLIQGESGTGKELVARGLHGGGARSGRFVAVNCGAIPESLIDSELFGHMRGAFTGASTDRAGVFVEADGGTLLLDEIGDMPMPVQARLLRVLQEGEIRAVGSSTTRKVDVRVIAASHVDLARAVEQRLFRKDLYYRLNVVKVDVPPLRERLDDIPLLAAHLIRKHGGVTPPSLAPEALQLLIEHRWPGNVRELENALLHAIALCQGNVIGVDALPLQIGDRARRPAATFEIDEVTFAEAKRRANLVLERGYLLHVIQKAKGSVSEAARLAGLDRTNFRRLLKRNGIDSTSFK